MANNEGAIAGLSVLIIFLLESSIFPFMLSSTFTARTVVKEKGQQEEVKTDLWIALGLSIAASIVAGLLTRGRVGKYVTIAGIVFGFVLTELYLWRGDLSLW